MAADQERPAAPPTEAEARRALNQAMLRLGIPFAECVRLVGYDPEAETAYWAYNKATGEESICVGPDLVRLPAPQLEMVLRHEILHRSLYNSIHERFADPQLENLVLDVCINRLLAESYPKAMREMCATVYADVPNDSLIQLANPAAKATDLADDIRSLYREIWGEDERARSAINPASLYFRLRRLGTRSFELVWARPGDGDAVPWPSDAVRRAAEAAWGDLWGRMPGNKGLGAELAEHAVTPAALNTAGLDSFVRRLRVRRVAATVRQTVLQDLEVESVARPYPLIPSRLGLVWQITGLSDLTCTYWNRESRLEGKRLALGMYLDVSGSMENKFPVVAAIARDLGEYPLKVRAFDEKVHDVELDDVCAGRIRGGGGTDFTAPVRDFLDDRELFAALLVTDGYGDVAATDRARLRRDGRPLHVIYLLDEDEQRPGGTLAGLSDQSLIFRVPAMN